jgi:amino acid permease
MRRIVAFPVAVISYVGYSIYWKQWLLQASEVDLVTGIREYDAGETEDDMIREPGVLGKIKHMWTA